MRSAQDRGIAGKSKGKVCIMGEGHPIVKLKLDIIFKRMFGDENNKDIIAAMLSALLEIPRESIHNIEITNVELPPEYYDQKFSRLDLKLNVDDKIVNVEMQVNYETDFRERTLFYWSKIYSDELKTGEEYNKLRKTFCVNIISFNLFDCVDYHSHFKVMEKDRHEVLSEKFAIHFFELKKIDNIRKNQAMEDWLHLINAETEEDLMAIQQTTTIPEVQRTIVRLRQMSADEKIRMEAYYREKRLHDEASALSSARAEGWAEGRAEGREEGWAEGEKKGRAEGRAEGALSFKEALIEKWRKAGMPEEQITSLLENQ